MMDSFKISFPGVGPVSERPEGIKVSELSFDNLRICFPGEVKFSYDRVDLHFDDVPLFGFLVDLTRIWVQARERRKAVKAVDFYDEYCLVLEIRDKTVIFQDEYAGKSICVPVDQFYQCLLNWSKQVFSSGEKAFPELSESAGYLELQGLVMSRLRIG